MKITVFCVIPVTLFVIMPCLATLKTRKIPNVENNMRVINWDNYQLPEGVPVEVFKTVLKNMDLYKRKKYCPFGKNMCSPQTYDLVKVVVKIIDDAVTDYEMQSEANDQVRELKMFVSPAAMKLSAPIVIDITQNNHDRMVANILNELRLPNQIDKHMFHEANRLEKLHFRPQYKNLRVPKKRNKGFVQKPKSYYFD